MAKIPTKQRSNLRIIFSLTEDGADANVSGCAARMQIRDWSGTLLVTATSDDYLTVGTTDGFVTCDIAASEMDLPADETYLADLELTYDSGIVRTTKTFEIEVLEKITEDS
jgi:hypothetical protein